MMSIQHRAQDLTIDLGHLSGPGPVGHVVPIRAHRVVLASASDVLRVARRARQDLMGELGQFFFASIWYKSTTDYYSRKLECVGIIGGTCITNNIWNTALACLNIGDLHGFSSAYGSFNGEKDRLSTIIIFIFSDNPNLTKLSCGLTMEYQGTIGDWNNLSWVKHDRFQGSNQPKDEGV